MLNLILLKDTPHSVGLLWVRDQPVFRDPYLTKTNTHKRQTSMLPAEFEPAIPTSEWSPTHSRPPGY